MGSPLLVAPKYLEYGSGAGRRIATHTSCMQFCDAALLMTYKLRVHNAPVPSQLLAARQVGESSREETYSRLEQASHSHP